VAAAGHDLRRVAVGLGLCPARQDHPALGGRVRRPLRDRRRGGRPRRRWPTPAALGEYRSSVRPLSRRDLLGRAALAAPLLATCAPAAPTPSPTSPATPLPPSPTAAPTTPPAPPATPTPAPPTAQPTAQPTATPPPLPTAPPAPPTATVPPTAVPPTPAPPASFTYLHPWQGDHGGARAIAGSLRRYRELHPNVTVHESVAPSDLERRQVAAFAAGAVPDVMLLFADTLPAYADRGLLLPLDDRLARDGIKLDDYFPIVAAQSSWAGRAYALTHHPDVRTVLYRNAPLLQGGGLPDRAPASWAELEAWAARVTGPDRLGWVPAWVEGHWSVLMPRANGAALLEDAGRRVAYESPQTVEALAFVVRATRALAGGPEGLADFEARQPGPGPETAYATGKLALAAGGSWYLDRVANGTKEPSALQSKLGALPGGPGAPGQTFVLGGGALNAIPARAGSPDAAWAYAAWVAGRDGQMLIQDVSYDVAGLRSAAHDPRIVAGRLLRAEMLALLERAATPAHLPTPAWPLMRDHLARAERALLTEQLPPARAAADLQVRLQAIVDAHHAAGRVPAMASHVVPGRLAAAPGPADPGANLLRNPGFEGGSARSSLSSSVAHGWSSWFRHRGPADPGEWLPEPEYGLVVGRGQPRAGEKAHRWFNSWSVHDAGIYQVVAVPEDAWLRFTLWLFGWSSQGDAFGTSDARHRRWLGIDPFGGTDPTDPRIVWSSADTAMDRWTQLAVTAQARGTRATVLARSTPDFPVKHNDTLADDAELRVVPPPADPRLRALLAAPPASSTNGATRADQAPLLAGVGAAGALEPGRHAYHAFDHPGGDAAGAISLEAAPDDASALARFGFRVYGPRWDALHAMSGLHAGARPNVATPFRAAEPGRYLLHVYNLGPTGRVDYALRIA
jgi:ABC-type glycerol-3-phosphate transport system substrate-binding protein